MKLNLDTFSTVNRPMYILEEARLRRNLRLIADVARKADVEIILAFKAYALWNSGAKPTRSHLLIPIMKLTRLRVAQAICSSIRSRNMNVTMSVPASLIQK